MDYLIIILLILAALVFLGWLGLKIQPASFPAYPQRTPALKTIPLPKGLPAPVERFYRQVYGEEVPVITSAVITGRAAMRPFGPFDLPARFRFTHIAGQDYRHYIEVAFFGIPIMKINEHFLDGQGRLELPFGVEEGEKINQGATLGLWAESIWFPALFLTDPRVGWEPLDPQATVLRVPYGTQAERFVVRFNPDTGLIDWMESMRYHGASSPAKTLWLNRYDEWGLRDGKPFSVRGAAIWMDDGKPWAVFIVEDIVFNVDVKEYIRAKGL